MQFTNTLTVYFAQNNTYLWHISDAITVAKSAKTKKKEYFFKNI